MGESDPTNAEIYSSCSGSSIYTEARWRTKRCPPTHGSPCPPPSTSVLSEDIGYCEFTDSQLRERFREFDLTSSMSLTRYIFTVFIYLIKALYSQGIKLSVL